MIFDLHLMVAAVSMAVIGLAATGTKVLYDFSRYELEMYCRHRNRRELFDEILDRHESLSVATETLQVVGTVVLVLAVARWFFASQAPATVPLPHLLGVTATTIVLLLALTIWIPWAIVRVWSAPFLYHSWRMWATIAWFCWPLTLGMRLVDVLAHRLAGQEEVVEDEEEAFEDEIRTIVTAGMRDGLLEADAREMIEGVMELGDVDVAEIMTPRSDVDAIDRSLTWPEVLRFVVKVGRTRIPVYDESLDHVIGILYVKDLLTVWASDSGRARPPWQKLLRKAWFVPLTKRVDDLLREFRRTRSHMAIVVDEYRATAGVVTIEDALEEIVGEIADETDADEELELVRIDQSSFEADGRIHIDELNDEFGFRLPESDEYDTIAGFMINQLGRIPTTGETLHWNRVLLTALKASPRRVERVRLELMEDAPTESSNVEN